MQLSPLWRNRDYMVLLAGQTVSITGTNASGIAFPLLVLAISHSPAQAGIVAALERVPFPILSLLAGALADRWDRKRVMILCDTGRTLAFTSLVLMLWQGGVTMPQIYAVALAEGVLSVFFNLAQSACLPQVVAKEQLPAATAQNQAVFALANIAGSPLGGLLYQVGRAVPFLADAVSYGVSAISLLFIRTRFQEERRPERRALWSEIGEGLTWLWRHPLFRFMAFLSGSGNLLFSAAPLVLIVLAKREMHASAAAIGIVFGIAASSAVVGSLLAVKIQRRFSYGQAIIGYCWVIALLWVLMAFAPNLAAIAVIGLALFLVVPTYDVVQFSYRLALTPDELQGRVNSVVRMIAFGGQPLGLAMSGALLQWIGPRPTILVLFGGLVLNAVAATLNRHVRAAPPIDEMRAA